jgi:hypothetical protein
MRALLALAVALVAACAGPPDLGAPPATRTGGWPRLVPLDGLLAQRDGLTVTPGVTAGLDARAAALSARAARLRSRPVIAPAERARLLATAARLASVARAPGSG